MAEYAVVNDADQVLYTKINADPATSQLRPGHVWAPVVVEDPPVDEATQLKQGPTVAVELRQGVKTVVRRWTVRAKTQAELDAEAVERKAGQIARVDNPMDVIRALALTVLDENNLQAQKFNQLQAAIAASTSLADMKTRCAAVGDMQTRTAAQLRTAINNKLGS